VHTLQKRRTEEKLEVVENAHQACSERCLVTDIDNCIADVLGKAHVAFTVSKEQICYDYV